MAAATPQLSQLNELQRRAATADLARPLLIVAAAGTGKSSTLAARVAYMVSQGVPPERILVLAYSRKAIEDLRARQTLAGRCHIRTIHAWAFRLLTLHWRQAGFSAPPTVMADDEQLHNLRRECLRLAKLDGCRELACGWLGLPLGAPWAAVIEQAAAVGLAAAGTPGTPATDAQAFAGLPVRDMVATLVKLFLALCQRHDRRLYRELPDDLVAASDAEVARCWRWLRGRPLALVPGAAGGPTQADGSLCSATTTSQGSGGDLARAVRERAGSFFRAECRRMNCCSLAELPALARDLLATWPEVLAAARERWTHLLVDEVQDLCRVQLDLVTLLQGGRGHVTAVGDDDQSIMSFNHALPGVFDDFRRQFTPLHVQVVYLRTNYRCTQAICDVGTAALAGNRGRQGKGAMEAARQGAATHPVLVRQYGTIKEEAAAVAEAISALLAEGRPAGDIAVLFRCLSLNHWAVHAPLAAELERLGVPYFVQGREKAAVDDTIQELLTYLQVLANPDDDLAVWKLLKLPKLNLGDAVLSALQQQQQAARLASPMHAATPSLLACARTLCKDSAAATAAAAAAATVPQQREQQFEAWGTEGLDYGYGGTEGLDYGYGGTKAEEDEASMASRSFYSGRARLAGLLQQLSELRAALYELSLPEALEWVQREAGLGLAEKEGTEGGQDAELAALVHKAQAFSLAWQPPPAGAPPSVGPASLQSTAAAAIPADAPLGQLLMGDLGGSVAARLAEGLAARSKAGPAPLRDFLTHLSEDAYDQGSRSNAVLIGTIHASKGLEWPVVFMPTVCEGHLPLFLKPQEGDPEAFTEAAVEAHLQEECRLFHVAVTRAKDQLAISYVQGPKALMLCPLTGEPRPMLCSHILFKVARQRSLRGSLRLEGRLPPDDEQTAEDYSRLWGGLEVLGGRGGGGGGRGAGAAAAGGIAAQASLALSQRGAASAVQPLGDWNERGAAGGVAAKRPRLKGPPRSVKVPRPAAPTVIQTEGGSDIA